MGGPQGGVTIGFLVPQGAGQEHRAGQGGTHRRAGQSPGIWCCQLGLSWVALPSSGYLPLHLPAGLGPPAASPKYPPYHPSLPRSRAHHSTAAQCWHCPVGSPHLL